MEIEETEPAAEPHNKFGAKKRALFLDAVSEHCNIRRAARKAMVSKTTAYRHYRSDPAFAAEWIEALRQGYVRLEERLLAHALRALDADDPDGMEADAAEADGADDDGEGVLRSPGEGEGALKGRTVFTNTMLAYRLLARHHASVAGGRMAPIRAPQWRSTPQSADEALRARLDQLARRLEKEAAAKGGGA